MSLQDAGTGIFIYVVASWVSCSLEGLRYGMLFAPGVILHTALIPESMSCTISIPGRGYCWQLARWWRQIQRRECGWLSRRAHHGCGWHAVSLSVRWYLDVMYIIFFQVVNLVLLKHICGIYCYVRSLPLPWDSTHLCCFMQIEYDIWFTGIDRSLFRLSWFKLLMPICVKSLPIKTRRFMGLVKWLFTKGWQRVFIEHFKCLFAEPLIMLILLMLRHCGATLAWKALSVPMQQHAPLENAFCLWPNGCSYPMLPSSRPLAWFQFSGWNGIIKKY